MKNLSAGTFARLHMTRGLNVTVLPHLVQVGDSALSMLPTVSPAHFIAALWCDRTHDPLLTTADVLTTSTTELAGI